jgi:hypothetical protein
MDTLSGNVSDMVFRQVVKDKMGDVFLNRQLLMVFLAIDGKKTLDVVAQESSINIGTIATLISRLLELELVEPVKKEQGILDLEFIKYLTSQLSLAVGPIAEILIEDEVAEQGFTPSTFPNSQAAELVDLLARQIQREEKRVTFELNMVKKIREKGY